MDLALLPNKFKKLIWIKRNDFVIANTSIPEDDPNATKVKFVIKAILNKDQIRHLKQIGKWPAAFTEGTEAVQVESGDHNIYNYIKYTRHKMQ